MKTLKVHIRGIAPLLMNSNAGADPTHPLVKEMKLLSAKGSKKRTETDDIRILDIKWLLGLYYTKTDGIYVPSINIEGTLRNAAKKTRQGQDTNYGLLVTPDRIPLEFPDKGKPVEEIFEDHKYRDVRAGKLKHTITIMLCRPKFDTWELKFNIEYDESVFNEAQIKGFLHTSGNQIGLCDFRPKYGRFEIISAK